VDHMLSSAALRARMRPANALSCWLECCVSGSHAVVRCTACPYETCKCPLGALAAGALLSTMLRQCTALPSCFTGCWLHTGFLSS
jgi:hypothetical protein